MVSANPSSPDIREFVFFEFRRIYEAPRLFNPLRNPGARPDSCDRGFGANPEAYAGRVPRGGVRAVRILRDHGPVSSARPLSVIENRHPGPAASGASARGCDAKHGAGRHGVQALLRSTGLR